MPRYPRHLLSLGCIAVVAFASALSGCPEDPVGPGIGQLVDPGGPCSDATECSSGLCDAGICAPANEPPVATIRGASVSIVGISASLSGGDSVDPEGVALTYAWSLVGQPNGSSATLDATTDVDASIVPDAPGLYSVQLTVSDGVHTSPAAQTVMFILDADGSFQLEDGDPCVDGVQCSSGNCADGVCQANSPPVADGGLSRTVAVGTEITLDSAGSSDPDGDALTTTWLMTQLPTGSAALLDGFDGATATFTPDQEGLYVVRLFVNDGFLGSAPATIAVFATLGEPELRADGEPCDKDEDCESQFCLASVRNPNTHRMMR